LRETPCRVRLERSSEIHPSRLQNHRVALLWDGNLEKYTAATAMTKAELSDIYRDYIACLNRQDWQNLGQFVHEEVHYNAKRIGLSGYREMLEEDFRAIPDLYFNILLLISDPPRIASRLGFDCTPKGILFGLPVNGKRISFTENVFYEFRDERIEKVWSIIDKAAIASQL
jgi:predicted ester cyclase